MLSFLSSPFCDVYYAYFHTSTRSISCMMAIDMLFSCTLVVYPRSISGYYCGILDDTLYFEEGLEKRVINKRFDKRPTGTHTLR